MLVRYDPGVSSRFRWSIISSRAISSISIMSRAEDAGHLLYNLTTSITCLRTLDNGKQQLEVMWSGIRSPGLDMELLE